MKLLDTSYLIDFERGRDPAREFFESNKHEALAVSAISTFELAYGVVWSSPGSLEELVQSLQWVDILDFSMGDGLEGARIQAELQKSGQRIPITDIMIAGVARNIGATIVTADEHFSHIDGLKVISYR